MLIIVYAGLPGAGKTHARNLRADLVDVPVLDMDRLRKTSEKLLGPSATSYYVWRDAMLTLLDGLDDYYDNNTEVVIVEGVFTPGSKSNQMLMDKVTQLSAHVEIQYISTEWWQCIRNILADFDTDHDEKRALGRMDIVIRRSYES